jgi:hypothetical protein
MWTLCKELNGTETSSETIFSHDEILAVNLRQAEEFVSGDHYAAAEPDTGNRTLISSPSGLRFEAVMDP